MKTAIRRSVYLHELRIGNLRRGNFDLVSAACVGLAASTTTALGAWLATIVDPSVGNVLFAVFFGFIAAQMAVKAIPVRRSH